MNQQIKERWLAALTSGEYKQTRQTLREDNRSDAENGYCYCCLGDLCDLYRQDHDDEATAFATGVYPTAPVLIWADLSSKAARSYAQMNDEHRMDFSEIATEIATDVSHWGDYNQGPVGLS